MQIVGIPGNCAEAGFSLRRPSRRKEAAKQDTEKTTTNLLHLLQEKKNICENVYKQFADVVLNLCSSKFGTEGLDN